MLRTVINGVIDSCMERCPRFDIETIRFEFQNYELKSDSKFEI